jgi:hypothetical protein
VKRKLLVIVLVVFSLLFLSGASADRTKCCHGCGSYACNEKNCGDKCSTPAEPRCLQFIRMG